MEIKDRCEITEMHLERVDEKFLVLLIIRCGRSPVVPGVLCVCTRGEMAQEGTLFYEWVSRTLTSAVFFDKF